MIERVIIAGAGGQGIMVLGKVLAEAAMKEDRFVTWLPAYGAEVRGGTAYCMVIISDYEIGSPHIDKADTLIIMNQPSWGKFKHRLNRGGLLIFNTSLVRPGGTVKTNFLGQPFTDIATDLGNIKVANMVATGFYIASKKIILLSSVLRAISDIAPSDKRALIEINKQALQKGTSLAKGK